MGTVTDKTIAHVCLASYASPALKWDRIWGANAGTCGIYACLAGNVLCFRGSVTVEDWLRDLDAVAIDDPYLGGLHAGFAEGMRQFYEATIQLLHPDTIVCGHSLGAARALIMAGYMAQGGLKPKAVITFGSPRPAFEMLEDQLSLVTIRSYKNRCDPVTYVPVPLYPLLRYMHPRDLIPIDAKPSFNDLEPLADHHIELYAEGVPETEIA